MKKLSALLLFVTYFALISGTICSDLNSIHSFSQTGNQEQAGSLTSGNSSKEKEFSIAKFIASTKHLAAGVKIKIPRPQSSVQQTGSFTASEHAYRQRPFFALNISATTIPIIIKNCVLRI